jgi:hypothetical protein
MEFNLAKVQDAVIELSHEPLSPEKNFNVAIEYERLGQSAAAAGFYLRAAEYGYGTGEYDLIVYAALLRVGACIGSQGDRAHTESNNILQAIEYLPTRPEGYFLLSRFYERNQQWRECYTTAGIGLTLIEPGKPLPILVEYPGPHGLTFEKAVASWWLGRRSESIYLLKSLYELSDIDQLHRDAVEHNLRTIGVIQ